MIEVDKLLAKVDKFLCEDTLYANKSETSIGLKKKPVQEGDISYIRLSNSIAIIRKYNGKTSLITVGNKNKLYKIIKQKFLKVWERLYKRS